MAVSETRRYRGVLFGAGGVARNAHLPAFGDPDIFRRLEIVAVVEPDGRQPVPSGLPRLASRSDIGSLGAIDFIDVCTPTSSHLDLTLWGLEHGYHVLCEKPVATGRNEAALIAAAARRWNRVVVPCHQYRFNPAWTEVAGRLKEGAIGRWHYGAIEVFRTAADQGGAAGAPSWRTDQAASLGGILLDHGTHWIYQILDVAGEPDGIQAWTGRLKHARYSVEDSAHVLFRYPDRIVTLFLTWSGRSRENRVRFIGDRGSLDWSGGEVRLERDGAVTRSDFSSEIDKSAYPRWFARLLGNFTAALDRGEAEASMNDIARVASIIERAYAAAADALPGAAGAGRPAGIAPGAVSASEDVPATAALPASVIPQ